MLNPFERLSDSIQDEFEFWRNRVEADHPGTKIDKQHKQVTLPLYHIMGRIEGHDHKIDLLLDTGSEANLIPLSMCKRKLLGSSKGR